MNNEEPTTWAIIELMGHQKIAGRYSERGAMHRVDVPGDGDEFRFTRLYSPQAIYSITFVDEQAARMAARALEVQPITIWEVNQEIRRLAAPAESGDVLDEYVEHEDYDYDDDYEGVPF
jgi:hypothetical protein